MDAIRGLGTVLVFVGGIFLTLDVTGDDSDLLDVGYSLASVVESTTETIGHALFEEAPVEESAVIQTSNAESPTNIPDTVTHVWSDTTGDFDRSSSEALSDENLESQNAYVVIVDDVTPDDEDAFREMVSASDFSEGDSIIVYGSRDKEIYKINVDNEGIVSQLDVDNIENALTNLEITVQDALEALVEPFPNHATLNFTEAPSSRWVNNSTTITDEERSKYPSLSEESLEEANMYVFITDTFGDQTMWSKNHEDILGGSKVILYDANKNRMLWDNSEQQAYALPSKVTEHEEFSDLSPVRVINQYVKYDAEDGLMSASSMTLFDAISPWLPVIVLTVILFGVTLIRDFLYPHPTPQQSYYEHPKRKDRSFRGKMLKRVRNDDNGNFTSYLREIANWVKKKNTRKSYNQAIELARDMAEVFYMRYPDQKENTALELELMEAALRLSAASNTLQIIESKMVELPDTEARLIVSHYAHVKDRYVQSLAQYKKHEYTYIERKNAKALSMTKRNPQLKDMKVITSQVTEVSNAADSLWKMAQGLLPK